VSGLTGAHVVVFSDQADATRAFLRDVLELDGVDAGQGWPIFGLPPAEVAVHPADAGGRQALYLMCDDIHATVDALARKGVEFTGDVVDARWGLLTAMRVPGAGEIALYEPRHPRP
jgi:catechol 2,3-dioxygenase-like lactoylglutathione lyase family enzyme